MDKLTVLGSTGSIGRNTLDIVKRIKKFDIVGLSCNKNINEISKQINEFKPKFVCVGNVELAESLKEQFPFLEVFYGEDGLLKLIEESDADLVVNALVGSAGLLPTYHCLDLGKRLALANKESLVIAGKILRKLADRKGVEIVPIDSEHSAIYQCLEGRDKRSVSKIILTASGGPFLDRESFENISVREALSHPNWNMGRKITIDSATMMNKGFEVIEARWLFGMTYDRIEIVIHRESIVHSAVEFIDGSIIAQMGAHDMRIPIAYALTKPDRVELPFRISLFELGSLTFEKPDFEKFKTLGLAYEALKKEDKNLGLVLNVADELAVDMFLKGKLQFGDIFLLLEEACERLEGEMPNDILEVVSEINRVRSSVKELLMKRAGG